MFSAGAVYLGLGLTRTHVLARGSARVAAGPLVVMALSRFVPL